MFSALVYKCANVTQATCRCASSTPPRNCHAIPKLQCCCTTGAPVRKWTEKGDCVSHHIMFCAIGRKWGVTAPLVLWCATGTSMCHRCISSAPSGKQRARAFCPTSGTSLHSLFDVAQWMHRCTIASSALSRIKAAIAALKVPLHRWCTSHCRCGDASVSHQRSALAPRHAEWAACALLCRHCASIMLCPLAGQYEQAMQVAKAQMALEQRSGAMLDQHWSSSMPSDAQGASARVAHSCTRCANPCTRTAPSHPSGMALRRRVALTCAWSTTCWSNSCATEKRRMVGMRTLLGPNTCS